MSYRNWIHGIYNIEDGINVSEELHSENSALMEIIVKDLDRKDLIWDEATGVWSEEFTKRYEKKLKSWRTNSTPANEEEFQEWFHFLLMSCARSGKYGMDHPLGSALMRELFRDRKVKTALRDAWTRLVDKGEEVDDND